MLLIAKFLITLLIVVGLSEVAKRVSATAAGILIGLPLGAGISVYFFTMEQGVAFTLGTVPWGIAGLSASIVFSLAYVLAGRAFRIANRALSVAVSTIAAVAVYVLFSKLLRLFTFDLAGATILTAAFIAGNILVIRSLRIPRASGGSKPLSLGIILFRAVTAGLTITVVTGLAGVIGPGWSGILSAFPAMLFPLLLVLHYEEGDRLYPGVVEGFAYSIFNLVIFYLLLHASLPRLGLNLSFVVLYAASAIVLWGIARIRSRAGKSADK